MNHTMYYMSEALKIAVTALQQYAVVPHKLQGGAYYSTYSDTGNAANQALDEISRLLEKAGYQGGGDAGSLSGGT